jgi:hypothetical protein
MNLRASITTLKQMLFPEINPSDWEMILSEFNKMKHLFDYTYQTYVRNKKTPQQTGVFLKQ